ncbi:MAG: MATE family efflux transporter [Gammaproteobacteria bacterium]|nr:MATE family efflux transporter [Gammaproteobacteria bacterium]
MRWWQAWPALIRQALSGAEFDYTRGSVGNAVVLLAVPMMLEMSMESLFAIVDIWFVASLGPEAVAAVGLTEAVLTLVYAVAIGASMGTTALVSRCIGAGDQPGARTAAAQTIWLGVALAMLIALPGVVYAPDILRLMGAEASVIEQGSGYTAVMLGGSVTILFLFLVNAIFRGAGDATIAMRSLMLANGLNIVLDPCLILGWGPFPEMGVTGAAVASTIGRGAGVLYQLCCLARGSGRIRLDRTSLALAPDVLLRLVRVSAGGVSQFLIATSSWIVLMRLVAPYGSAAVAGYTIGIRILAFTLLPAWGLANAAATLVGQNLGAGEPQRAEQAVWYAARFNAVVLGAVALVCLGWTPQVIGLFSDDPEVLAYGISCLRIAALGYGFYAVGMVMVQAFNGAGDTDTPTLINLGCFWMLQLPLAYTLSRSAELGADGVFLAMLAAESLVAVVAVITFRRGRWKHRVV